MVLERVLTAIAAIAVPALGFVLRASRRNRLRHHITEYLELADEVAAHDHEAAERFRQLARDAADLLIARENRWLRRRFEPAAIFAMLFFVAPAVVVVIVAWDWDSGWKVPVIVLAIIWALVWTIAAATQLWQERGDTSRSSSDAGKTSGASGEK